MSSLPPDASEPPPSWAYDAQELIEREGEPQLCPRGDGYVGHVRYPGFVKLPLHLEVAQEIDRMLHAGLQLDIKLDMEAVELVLTKRPSVRP